MENDTFYCSFVGVQFIVCECGESFETEEVLKIHLENGHKKKKQHFPKRQQARTVPNTATKAATASKTPQAPIYVIKNSNEKVVLKYPKTSISNPSRTQDVLFAEIPRASNSKVLIKQEVLDEPITTTPIKQEVVYEMDNEIAEQELIINENDDYLGHTLYRLQDGTTLLVQEIPMELQGTPEVIKEQDSQDVEGEVIGEVTFRKEMIKDEVVILDEELGEHDYHVEPKQVVEQFFFCDVCGKSCSSRAGAMAHIARMHTRNEVERLRFEQFKQIICDICAETYAECECGSKRPKKDRDKVKIKKNLEKKFICDVCQKGFYSNASLRYHQRIHTGERPYHCTYCPKAFTMPLFLQIHIRTHTGERPYACQHCPKAFTNRAALMRHDRVHTGEKPYSCPHCMKPFSQSNSMKLHVHTVHMKLPTPYKSKARQIKAAKLKVSNLKRKQREEQLQVSDDETQQEEISVVEEMTYQDDSDSNYYDDFAI